MIFLQSITLTNSPALRGHGDGLQDLDRLNAFFLYRLQEKPTWRTY